MVFPVKWVMGKMVKEFAASNMRIDAFAYSHRVKADTLKARQKRFDYCQGRKNYFFLK